MDKKPYGRMMVYIDAESVQEIREVAALEHCAISTIVQRAWRKSRDKIRKMPAAEKIDE